MDNQVNYAGTATERTQSGVRLTLNIYGSSMPSYDKAIEFKNELSALLEKYEVSGFEMSVREEFSRYPGLENAKVEDETETIKRRLTPIVEEIVNNMKPQPELPEVAE